MISMLNCYRNQPAFNCLEIGFDHIHTGLVQGRGMVRYIEEVEGGTDIVMGLVSCGRTMMDHTDLKGQGLHQNNTRLLKTAEMRRLRKKKQQ